jgi:hypothetical protein
MEYEVLLLIGTKGISIMTVGALYEHYDCIFGACEEKDCSYSYTLQVKLGRHPDEREEQEGKTEKIGTEIREKRKERETDVREEERTERRDREERGTNTEERGTRGKEKDREERGVHKSSAYNIQASDVRRSGRHIPSR